MKAKSDTVVFIYQVPKSVLIYVKGVLAVLSEVVSLIFEVWRQANSN